MNKKKTNKSEEDSYLIDETIIHTYRSIHLILLYANFLLSYLPTVLYKHSVERIDEERKD